MQMQSKRFRVRLSLDQPGMWRVVDVLAIYGDSRAMAPVDAEVTCAWLNEAHEDWRLRVPDAPLE